MKDGTMFRDLHLFEDLTFFEEHTKIIVYTPEEIKNYRIIAAVNYDDCLLPDRFHNFAEKKDLLDFLGSVSLQGNTVTNHQVVGEDIYQADQYIVLSTCTAKSDVRYLVIGEIIEGE
jgi:sortase B